MNRDYPRGIIAAVISASVALGIWFFTSSKIRSNEVSVEKSESKIAEIDNVNGKASLKTASDEIGPLIVHSPVLENSTLITDAESNVLFHIESGAKFEMAPLTKIVLQRLSQKDGVPNISITVLEGQIQLVSNADVGSQAFEVTKKGRIVSVQELRSQIDIVKPSLPEPSQIQTANQVSEKLPAPNTTAQPNQVHSPSLNQEDINKVMRNQTSFLHRCYINYMLRSQKLDLSGQVVLSFVIQPTGFVTNSKIISSPIQDDQLEHCLTDVIGRATFKEFKAQPIFVQAYPIHLD